MMPAQVDVSIGPESKNAPAVSVIMPAYNTASLIVESLDSVFAQTYTSFEVIAINDGSPDTEKLEEVLRPYRTRIVYLKQNNRRAAGARNTGIQQARGEYLAFLDSDDCWMPDYLAAQMKLFNENPSLDMVYADALYFDGPHRPGKTYMQDCPSKGPVSFESILVEDSQVCISCTMARKAIIEKAGLFDESLPRCDDYDMWLRVAYCGGNITYQTQVLGKIRMGRAGSLGLAEAKMHEAEVQILTKLEKTAQVSPETRSLMEYRIARAKAYYEKARAKDYIVNGDFDRAAASLRKADNFFHGVKLKLAILGIKIAPRLVRSGVISRGHRDLGST